MSLKPQATSSLTPEQVDALIQKYRRDSLLSGSKHRISFSGALTLDTDSVLIDKDAAARSAAVLRRLNRKTGR